MFNRARFDQSVTIITAMGDSALPGKNIKSLKRPIAKRFYIFPPQVNFLKFSRFKRSHASVSFPPQATSQPDVSDLPHLRKWKGSDGSTKWYRDLSPNVQAPPLSPDSPSLKDGDIYAHYSGDGKELAQMWVRISDGDGKSSWIMATEGFKHPDVNRVLIVSSRNEPSWVFPKTLASYNSPKRSLRLSVQSGS
jgi:hypothetical protein